ncbi:MAG: hypothetical protein M1825_003092 [Sarcosagium campestre]|nr:MAG: hypothetical protein M1825_003092 [Sarcosagium campestre]
MSEASKNEASVPMAHASPDQSILLSRQGARHTSQSSSLLFVLPPEVRLQIWRFVVAPGHIYLRSKGNIGQTDTSSPQTDLFSFRPILRVSPSLELLQTCRQIRAEALHVFLRQNMFYLGSGNTKETCSYLERIPSSMRCLIQRVAVRIHPCDIDIWAIIRGQVERARTLANHPGTKCLNELVVDSAFKLQYLLRLNLRVLIVDLQAVFSVWGNLNFTLYFGSLIGAALATGQHITMQLLVAHYPQRRVLVYGIVQGFAPGDASRRREDALRFASSCISLGGGGPSWLYAYTVSLGQFSNAHRHPNGSIRYSFPAPNRRNLRLVITNVPPKPVTP